jgi:hypothetical protein
MNIAAAVGSAYDNVSLVPSAPDMKPPLMMMCSSLNLLCLLQVDSSSNLRAIITKAQCGESKRSTTDDFSCVLIE